MSDVRTFRAGSMKDALDLVRRELGPEAIILQTRQRARRRFLPWRKRRDEVEITAGLGIKVRAQALPPPGSAAARRSARRVDLVAGETPPRLFAAPTPEASDGPATAIAKRLDAIQNVLRNLELAQRAPRREEVPAELFDLYARLLDAEVEEDVARRLTGMVREECDAEQWEDREEIHKLLVRRLAAMVNCGGPIRPVCGSRKVVALAGATGVGKTTTIAKLAANFRLRDGIRMGLVTVDTYRIAAVEQLRTYAEIIDLPMKVVASPPEMRRAMQDMAGLDLILIDTAGRSPRDELQIHELKSLLSEAAVDEVHLVLSMTTGLKTLQSTLEKFLPVGPTALILTKLDEAAGYGSILSLSAASDTPISYLTTGQDVPDDIEAAGSERIARLILGEAI
ncbi:MAG: flagellar biosynthesis protein FlhF [Planctomycetaceae bacterium]